MRGKWKDNNGNIHIISHMSDDYLRNILQMFLDGRYRPTYSTDNDLHDIFEEYLTRELEVNERTKEIIEDNYDIGNGY